MNKKDINYIKTKCKLWSWKIQKPNWKFTKDQNKSLRRINKLKYKSIEIIQFENQNKNKIKVIEP